MVKTALVIRVALTSNISISVLYIALQTISMDRSLIALIAGLILWYAIKYTFRWEHNTMPDWHVRMPYVLLCIITIIFAACVWLLPTCSYSLHVYAAYLLIVSSVALALDMLDGTFVILKQWTLHPAQSIAPGHAACACALAYLNGAALRLSAATTCSVFVSIAATSLLCVFVSVAQSARGGCLQRKRGTRKWHCITREIHVLLTADKRNLNDNDISTVYHAPSNTHYEVKIF